MSRAVQAADYSLAALASALGKVAAATPTPERRPFDAMLEAEARRVRDSWTPVSTDLVFAAQNQALQAALIIAHADLTNALVAARASHRIALAAQAIAAARAAEACSRKVSRLDLLA